ncbi:MAG: VOC family protein [Chloroflexia bacterium]|nr:VOC family protein [Chloroflexia bacterium]
MTILHGVVFDCRDAAALAGFWKEALGWEYRTQRSEDGWITIQPPGGDAAMSVGFGEVPEGKSVKNRVHLDIRPSPGVGWEAERTRLETLGATTFQFFENAHYIMADPEGNEFCLLNPKWY